MGHFEVHPLPSALDADLLAQLALAEVATIGHWRRWGFPDRAIQRVGTGPTVVGTAITVACPGDDNTMIHYAIGMLRPGDILVVDRLGDTEHACWGGVVNHAIKARGAAGAVVDGPCTDLKEIRESGFPLWCRGVSGRTANGRGEAGRFNVPVSIGGAVVMPGDALLCDDDGVLVLPPSDIAAEAERAIRHQAGARDVLARLDAGASLAEISGAQEKIFPHGAHR